MRVLRCCHFPYIWELLGDDTHEGGKPLLLWFAGTVGRGRALRGEPIAGRAGNRWEVLGGAGSLLIGLGTW